jgi:hypothetical protein
VNQPISPKAGASRPEKQRLIVKYRCGHEQPIEFGDVSELTSRTDSIGGLLLYIRTFVDCPNCSMKKVALSTEAAAFSFEELARSTQALSDAMRSLASLEATS